MNKSTGTITAPTTGESLMEIHCQKQELFRGVQLVQSAISPRSTLPVLSNILLETSPAGLRLSSTDLEVGVRCLVRADVTLAGAITVPAKTLADFLRTIDDDRDVSLTLKDGQRLEIRSLRDRCVVACLPKDDYPVLPEFSMDRAVTLKQSVLREMIRKTLFSVSTDETRYVLNGVDFVIEGGRVMLVATDGRRLAFIERDIADTQAVVNAIIPTKAVTELARVLGTDEKGADVQMGFTDNQVTFQYRDIVIISRLIDGHFPSYDQVIPKSHDTEVRLKTKTILQATQRATVGTVERGGSVRFSLSPGRLQIHASAQGRVEVDSDLEVAYTGEPMVLGLNPVYLVDVFKALECDDIVMELSTPLTPCVIRPVGDDRYRYVVMPMQAG